MTREQLKDLGFKEIPHFTVGNSLIYDLGRKRQLSVSCVGTPNEMVFLGQIDHDNPKKITDLIVLKNYDYDGYTDVEVIKTLIELLSWTKKSS